MLVWRLCLLGLAWALLSAVPAWAEPLPTDATPAGETSAGWGRAWWNGSYQTARTSSAPAPPPPPRWSSWPSGGWAVPQDSTPRPSGQVEASPPWYGGSLGQSSGGARRIEVSIRHNLAEVQAFEGDLLARAFHAFAGLPDEPTPAGIFRVQALLGTLRTAIWQARSGHEWDLPYFVQFADDYGFHGPMLDARTGAPSLTFTAGCLALTFDDARWLYDWATPGTPIHIVSVPS